MDFYIDRPPFKGWWFTRIWLGNLQIHVDAGWRWWTGEGWSAPWHSSTPQKNIPRELRSTRTTENVEWSYVYPENARVPRVNHDGTTHARDGKEVFPNMEGFSLSCCRCGLKHIVKPKVYHVVGRTKAGTKLTPAGKREFQISLILSRAK